MTENQKKYQENLREEIDALVRKYENKLKRVSKRSSDYAKATVTWINENISLLSYNNEDSIQELKNKLDSFYNSAKIFNETHGA